MQFMEVLIRNENSALQLVIVSPEKAVRGKELFMYRDLSLLKVKFNIKDCIIDSIHSDSILNTVHQTWHLILVIQVLPNLFPH